MNSFWYYLAVAICLFVGARSVISGIKGENRILWLSINSANQKHYEKYARVYNIIIGGLLVFMCFYMLLAKLLNLYKD